MVMIEHDLLISVQNKKEFVILKILREESVIYTLTFNTLDIK